jgi:hypothetical protein
MRIPVTLRMKPRIDMLDDSLVARSDALPVSICGHRWPSVDDDDRCLCRGLSLSIDRAPVFKREQPFTTREPLIYSERDLPGVALAVKGLKGWPSKLKPEDTTTVERDLAVVMNGGSGGVYVVPVDTNGDKPQFAPDLTAPGVSAGGSGLGQIVTPGRIPRGGAADPLTQLLFVADGTAGLTIIDLAIPGGSRDEDDDGIDDRVLGTVSLGGARAEKVAVWRGAAGAVVVAVAAGKDGLYFTSIPQPVAAAGPPVAPRFARLTASARLFPTISGVYSDQLPGRDCNFAPETARPDRERIYMGAGQAPVTNTAHAHLRVHAEASSPDDFVGILRTTHGDLLARETITPPSTDLSFEPTLPRGEYRVVAGTTCKSATGRSVDQIKYHFPYPVKVIRADAYGASLFMLNRFASAPGVGGQFVRAFLDGTVPAEALPSTVTISASDPDLHLPVGALWGSDCTSAIPLYTYGPSSSVAAKMAASIALSERIRSVTYHHRPEIVSSIDPAACLNPIAGESSCTFGPWGWGDPSGTSADGQLQFSDLALVLAFKSVRLRDTRLAVTVRAEQLADAYVLYAHWVIYSGDVEDTWEFGYSLNDFPGEDNLSYFAVPAQIGYASLGSAGRIFASRVSLDVRDQQAGFEIGRLPLRNR